ncbi:MAG: two-component regulator propeller domain-containing protein [Opitutaceae bacterium]
MRTTSAEKRRIRRPIAAWTAALFCLLTATRGLALDPAKAVSQYNCATWTRQTGLPVNGINAIAQTKDGYLWLGTAAGLVRFDGVEFKPFDLTSVAQLRTTIVTSLAAAREGGLWVGLENSAFGFHDSRSFSFRGKTAWGGDGLMVHALAQSRDGSLWFGGDSNANRLTHDGSFEPVLHSSDDSRFTVTSVYEDAQGRVWLGTVNRGAYYWHAGAVAKLNDPGLDSTIIRCIAQGADGQIFLGTPLGIYCYDAQLGKKELLLKGDSINVLLCDRQGALWIGTARGLFRYRDGALSAFQKSDGLAGQDVKAIVEDSEGSLWIGTQDGLSHLTDVKFPTHAIGADLAPGVLAVAASARGGIWAAHGGGITYLDGKTKPKTYSSEAGLTESSYKRVFEASNGDIYAVGDANTLVTMSEERVVSRVTAASLVVGMAEDAQGVVVSVGPDLFRPVKNSLVPYAFAGGKAPAMLWILNLVTGRDGALWVSSVGGIFRIKDGAFEQWTDPTLKIDLRTQWIGEDQEGVIWAATLSGIVRLKDNQVRQVGRDQGLFDNNIYSVVPDDFGQLWVDSGRGLFRVSRQSMNDCADGKINRVECVPYDGEESVVPTDKRNQERVACKTADGRIWFPSAKGVVMVDPAHILANQIAPPVHIDRIRANKNEFTREGGVVAPPGPGELEIYFAALSFVAPQKVRFRYRLEGYDRDWVEVENRRFAFYTNLAPGHYTFHVTAANADGVWNQTGDSLPIALQPYFFQTTWFYALGGGLVFSMLTGAYFWRIRELRRKERALQENRLFLETEVGNRTAELQQENAERKRAEEELANSLSVLHATLESTVDGILVVDRQGKVTIFNHQFADMWRIPRAILDAREDERALAVAISQLKEPATFMEKVRELYAQPDAESFDVLELKDGRTFERYSQPHRVHRGIVGRVWCFREITGRRQAEAKLADTNRQLLSVSREAGMAEVATSVLHNVGNVLNSVNVSATLVTDRVRRTKSGGVAKLAALFEEHQADLAGLMTQDRGQKVPGYLRSLAEALASEQKTQLEELDHLRTNIDHIKDIVAMQQSYAKTSGFIETVPVVDLVEDALRMNVSSLLRHDVELVRDFQLRPTIETDKHQVLQILVNLVANAKQACDETGRPDKRIVVRMTGGEGSVAISVTDNGVGIPAENLTRIFNHGFTTKKEGHGFGLHSGALAAKELGGSLRVSSAGPGLGATFTLELPLRASSGPSAPAPSAGHNPESAHPHEAALGAIR